MVPDDGPRQCRRGQRSAGDVVPRSLAVAVGYRGQETVDLPAQRDWIALLHDAERLAQETTVLAATVRIKKEQEEETARAVAEGDDPMPSDPESRKEEEGFAVTTASIDVDLWERHGRRYGELELVMSFTRSQQARR